MAVNLSPVGGVAAQFLDNNGNVLTGGKIYTYAAGTTTPQASYTSAAGTTAHSNPIILDASGRVPSGEIWLTDGLQYKVAIYTADNVLIGTYDNVIGINSNFVNFVTAEEVQIATAGQTVFTLTTMQYQPGTNNLVVYVDGVNQVEGGSYSYVETNSTTVTFTAGLHVGAVVKFVSAEVLSTNVTDASTTVYTPAGSGAVVTNVQAKLRETVSVKDFGAVGDGVADDTTAFNNAPNGSWVTPGTYKTNTAITANKNFVTYGFVDFTGANPVDGWSPAFGSGTLGVFTTDRSNAFIGKVLNNEPAATIAFPTGVTGYGRYNNAGNTAFGLFGRSDAYAAGVATNEVNSFNYAGTPSNSFPPDRSIGTVEVVPVALTVAAGGDYPSCMGIAIGREGSEPQPFRTGLYFNPDGYTDYGIFIDAFSGTTGVPFAAKHRVDMTALQIRGVGTPVASNAWLVYDDGNGVSRFGVKQDGRLSFSTGVTQTTVGAAGAATVLPSNPTGYLKIEIAGSIKVIPYYEP